MLTHQRISDLCFLVEDLDRAIAFYRDRLGFALRRHAPGFADFHTQGTTLALWERSHMSAHVGIDLPVRGPRSRSVMGAIELESPEEVINLHEELSRRGVEFLAPPRSYPWNAFACYFKDPDENLWELYVWQEGGHQGHFHEGTLPQ